MLKNVNLVCRICLAEFQSVKDLILIFDDNRGKSTSTPTFILIMSCAAVQILQTDKLPQRLCRQCFETLKKMCQFRELVEQSDAKLRAWLEDHDNKKAKSSGKTQRSENGSVANMETNLICMNQESISSNVKENNSASNSRTSPCKEEAVPFIFPETDENNVRGDDFDIEETACNRQVFSCSSCSKTCLTAMGLKAHLKTHAGSSLSCPICGKNFAYKRLLTQHKLTHQTDRLFHCAECNKAFKTKGRLKVHTRRHFNDRPFGCRLCDKRFFQACHRDQHEGLHTGDRHYACHKCEKHFRSQTGLKGHLRKHEGMLPFQCEICGKQFALKSSLRNHTRSQKCDQKYVHKIHRLSGKAKGNEIVLGSLREALFVT